MRILYVSNVRSHIGQFHTSFINLLHENGHTIDVSCFDNSADKDGYDFEAINQFKFIPLQRSPFKLQNLKAISQLKNIIKSGNYDLIHCHTPMGAVAARVAAKRAKSKAAVIYTAHGFHFFKGASIMNWLFFYPVEKLLAYYTNTLITINTEDYNLAKNKKFKVKDQIVKINGVGVDLSKFSVATIEDKQQLRKEYGYGEDEFILIYPADYSHRKNHEMLFETVSKLKEKIPTIKVLMPGYQPRLEEYKKIVSDLGINQHIEMLGYRRDIHKLIALSDISVSVSRQEGLPVNLIEALAIGKPIVATDVRGNSDLVENGVNGFLAELNNSEQMAEEILEIYKNPCLAEKMSHEAVEMSKKYSIENVNKDLVNIYQKYEINFDKIPN